MRATAVVSRRDVSLYTNALTTTEAAMPNLLILTEVQESMRARYREMLLQRFPQLHIDVVGHHSLVDPYIAETDVLLCFSPPMADHVVRDARKLKWIQALGTGVDNIVDLPSLGKEVLVSNVRGIHGAPVSEATVAFMLSMARDMPRTVHAQDRREWDRFPARLLAGKTVGILGVGLIAEYLAPICKTFGMTVVGITGSPREAQGFDRMVARSDLLKVAPELDFLVVLIPMSAETRNIVGAAVFKAMKPSAYLVNVARGGVVDEDALMAALETGEIAGAGLDVFSQEPLPPESPLWTTRNATIFPHLGGYSEGYEERAMPTIAHNMACFLEGRPKDMINIVRKPASWRD
jgi:phosphoglycerate dehydrogenase-like enzyme